MNKFILLFQFAVVGAHNMIGMDTSEFDRKLAKMNDDFFNIGKSNFSFESFFKSQDFAQEEEINESQNKQIFNELTAAGLLGKLPRVLSSTVPHDMEELIALIDMDRPLQTNRKEQNTLDYYHKKIGCKIDSFLRWKEVIKNTHAISWFCLVCTDNTIKKIATREREKSVVRGDRRTNLFMKCLVRNDLYCVLRSYLKDQKNCPICSHEFEPRNALKHFAAKHLLEIISHKAPRGLCCIEGYKENKD